jgi:hypothetical protein
VSDHPHLYRAFSADGHTARWNSTQWDSSEADNSGDLSETLTLNWDNEAWTASGHVEREHVQYVMRISPTWQVRQFLLFRDMDEPDLWLGTDGGGRWGEMNGAHRPELDGCIDVDLACTPFTNTIPIRRLALHLGDCAEIMVASIDVETLDVQPSRQRYTRLEAHRWRFEQLASGASIEFDVDEFGLVVDYPSMFRRVD